MPSLPYLDLLLLCLVLCAAGWDLATRKIPNRLLAAAWLAGLACIVAFSPRPVAALLTGLGGALACFALYLPLYALRGMAAGDVKLIATVGLLAGPGPGLTIAVLAWCAGGVMGLAMMLFNGTWRSGFANLRHLLRPLMMRLAGMPAAAEPIPRSAGSMPYGVAIAAGTLGFLWARHM